MPFVLAVALIGILFSQPQFSSLRIVVVEGEDAVNIVQQNTAVRPLVEVRDRNNLPVPGATVTFTVGSGQPAAFAGGAQTMTVTTNASGQAAAAGFNATGAGRVTIQVQTAHQGQIASTAITQTNFLTAAAAAAAGVTATAAGAAAGSTGGAGTGAVAGTAGATGAGGAGGGLSLTTIALVGGAVAGGAVVAQQTGLIGGNTYTGTLSGQYVWTNSGRTGIGTPVICGVNRTVTGSMEIELNGDGASGKAAVRMTHTDVSVTTIAGTNPCNFNGHTLQHGVEAQVSGGPSALTFSASETGTGVNQDAIIRYSFSGSLSGDTITGTLTWETQGQTAAGGNTFTSSGSITIPVTLQR